MSYTVPVVMEEALGSTTKMGIVLAFSSFCGTFCDFFFAKAFVGKKSRFFNKILISSAFLFPLSFLAYRSVPSFLFAMAVWGVYYEAMIFSNYHAVHEFVHPKDHLWAWGTLVTLKNLAWFIGPNIASILGDTSTMAPFVVSFFFYGVATFLFVVRRLALRIRRPEIGGQEYMPVKHSLRQEMNIWKIYGKTLWPLLGMMFLFFLIDSAFFSIGPVFAESLKGLHPFGGLFISMYTFPCAAFVMLSGPFARAFGKKRAAFLFGMWAGVLLMLMSQIHSIPLILILTFIASIGLGIMYPQLSAVFEDFVARSGRYGNDIIGLTAMMGSIGYVVGPILAGVFADRFGTQFVFGFWGVLLFFFCVVAFLVMKRKVKLPFAHAQAVSTQSH